MAMLEDTHYLDLQAEPLFHANKAGKLLSCPLFRSFARFSGSSNRSSLRFHRGRRIRCSSDVIGFTEMQVTT